MTRPAQNTDFDFFFGLYMHPEVNPFLLYELMKKEEFEPIFTDLLAKNQLYVFSEEGKDIGMFKLVPLTYRCEHIVYLGGVGINPEFSGKGFGKTMLQEIIDLCQQKGYLRIELSVADINQKAIHLYQKVGFQREGVLKKYTHLKSEKRFLDEVMMAYLFDNERN